MTAWVLSWFLRPGDTVKVRGGSGRLYGVVAVSRNWRFPTATILGVDDDRLRMMTWPVEHLVRVRGRLP